MGGIGQTGTYAGVITKFMQNLSQKLPPIIYGDGSQTRDFIHVLDVATANLEVMNSSLSSGFFNVGTGKTISIKELAETMIDLSGKTLELTYDDLPLGDVKDSLADVSLAKQLINWNYQTLLKNGLKKFFF